MNPMKTLWAFVQARKETSRGFTLIELLVVIAIIGILSSVVLASLNTARKKGRDARRISDMKQIQLALELYYDSSSNGSYPVGSHVGDEAGALDELAPDFISVLPLDPGSTDYEYQALDGSDDECGSGSCGSYVLKAVLENTGGALGNDIDGTVGGIECGPNNSTDTYYCVRP